MVTADRWVLLGLAALTAACERSPSTPGAPEIEVPADLAAVQLTAEGTTTAPYTMLELNHPDGFSGFVMVNDTGGPVWYFRTEGAPFSFTRRGNGHYVLLDSERGLVEVTTAGRVVRELPQEERPGRRMHHDVTATPWGTILFLAEDQRRVGDVAVTGEAVWEWAPEAGTVAERWNAFDHLDWNRDRGSRSRPDDWLHANSISLGPSGNLVMSLHFLNQVISIEPGFGGIEWRLGGVGATIPVVDPFSGQHTAREVTPGRVLLFDNGYEREEERYSRAVEYQIEEDSAPVAWEWRPDRDNWARVISGARRLPNGNTLVAFGLPEDPERGWTGPIEVYEVTAGGRVVWHLLVAGEVSSMYRATPIPSF